MSVHSEMLGRSAAPHLLEHKGKTYTVRQIGQKEQSAYEEFLFLRERNALGKVKDILSADEFDKRLDKLLTNYRRGAYTFLGELGQAALLPDGEFVDGKFVMGPRALKAIPIGLLGLGPILLDCDLSEFISVLLAKGQELTALIKLVIRESFPDETVNEETKEPNPQ